VKGIEVRFGEQTVMVLIDPSGHARLNDESYLIVPVGPGVYRVSSGPQRWTVAVAGPADDRWVFVDGRVARLEIGGAPARRDTDRLRRKQTTHDLASPMPATVIRVLVEPGQKVARGDTLVVLEAMKMELPIRAPRDAVVRAVHCRAGELVQPGLNLLDLE